MNEVFEENASEVTFEDKITFKVCTLPGIVLLKFIAWDDRPEIRRDDLIDIADIIYHFFNIYDELIWNEHDDLFDEDKKLENISARVLGRKIGGILKKNERLKERILNMLTKNVNGKAITIATIIAETLEKAVDEISELLKEIVEGINEK